MCNTCCLAYKFTIVKTYSSGDMEKREINKGAYHMELSYLAIKAI